MVLKKVIKSCMIKNEYEEFVEQFLLRVLKKLGDNVHSIYICGSIPKGKAELYKSDADFTIVCKSLERNIDKDEIVKIKSELLNEYPFVTKIDTTIITLSDVKSKPLDWGFWIKIICYCIYGVDLGEEVPELITDSELILSLLSDFEESINKLKYTLDNTKDKGDVGKTIRGYSKRLIRSLYTLILEDVGEWQDDILEMKNALSIYMKENSLLVDNLYLYYINQQSDLAAFESWADQASNIIYSRLEQLAASRNFIVKDDLKCV
ncbi:hypothetical protein [Alkaliphilus transvaalensis]|uniref:hypothetical protein n=1 Tax=Alkaliphilus transvaalensis TaxID=114628 RepID=UPI00047BA6C3|nr:hypothetical protein [Alkaliphilus transvaalensis]